jgi:hypothetical protein
MGTRLVIIGSLIPLAGVVGVLASEWAAARRRRRDTD